MLYFKHLKTVLSKCNCNWISLLLYLGTQWRISSGVFFLLPPPFSILRNSAFYPFKCEHWEFHLTCNQERILRIDSWDLWICIKGKTTESFHTWKRGGNNELYFRSGYLGANLLIQTSETSGVIPSFIYHLMVSFLSFDNWNVSNLNSFKLVSYLLLPCTQEFETADVRHKHFKPLPILW